MNFKSLSLLAAAGLCTLSLCGSVSAAELRVATNPTFPPFEFQDSNTGTIQGFEMDLVAEIAKKLGDTVKIDKITFDGIIPAILSGSVDLGAGLTVNVPAPSQFSDYAWNWSLSIEWTRELTERAGNVSFGLAGTAGETARSMDWPERNRLAGSVSLELLRKSGFSAAMRLDGETMGSAHSAGAASAELRWTW